MILIPIALDNALNALPIHTVCFQLIANALLDIYFPSYIGDPLGDVES